jgi:hypothetical protein
MTNHPNRSSRITIAVEPDYADRVRDALDAIGASKFVRLVREPLGTIPSGHAMGGSLRLFRVGQMPRGGWPFQVDAIVIAIRSAVGYP